MEFMLETIYDIKNNKKKAEEVNPRIKKWLQKVLFSDPCFMAFFIIQVPFCEYTTCVK